MEIAHSSNFFLVWPWHSDKKKISANHLWKQDSYHTKQRNTSLGQDFFFFQNEDKATCNVLSTFCTNF